MCMAIGILFSQCDQKASQEDENLEEDSITSQMNQEIDAMASVQEELSEEQKVRNMYKNTSAVVFNVLVVSFDEVFKEEIKTLTASIGSGETTEKETKNLEVNVDDFSDDFKNKLDSGLVALDQYFDQLKTEDEEMYNKIFANEKMQKGVLIAENYDLPEGFAPLHENLDEEEITRYVIQLAANSESQADPLSLYMAEVMQWFGEVSNELESDPEIKAYMEAARQS